MSDKQYPCDYCGSEREADEMNKEGLVFCNDHDCEDNFREENPNQ